MARLDPSQGLALITDGSASCQDKSGGWAWIALDALDGIAKQSGANQNVTNNQMELAAPTHGLQELFRKYGACEVLVYADSLYVVKGAMDRRRARNKNKQYWQALDKAMGQHTSVEFMHVRGHAGHIWNEMADEMAGKARRKGKPQ